MALWFGLMIIFIVITFCWVPSNSLKKTYQEFEAIKEKQEKQEEREEFERRYKNML